MQTVLAQLDAVAERRPRHVAIYWGNERIRYAQLQSQIRQVGANLQGLVNLEQGDRVGLFLKNSPQFIYALYAILKSGAVAVPINTFLKPFEIQHIVDDCQLTGLITDDVLYETAAKVTGPKLICITDLCGGCGSGPWSPAAPPEAGKLPPATPSLTDLAVIIYTSGTTGKAKGALLTHANFAANVSSCVRQLEETGRDRVTLLLPLFHSFMITVCVFTPLCLGASIVLIKSVQPFHHAVKEIIRARATVLVGIPQLFQAMVHAKVPFYVHWLLNLRLAVSGAAPLPGETLAQFDRKFGFPLLEGYGLSEASPVVSFNPIHGVRKPGSVGLPLPDVAVKIFDENDVELPVDNVGEIVVRGPNVMRGYHNQPEETAAALRHGWLHTGDLGKKDADGYLYIVDRKKDMLLVHGMNVYPREIEEVLHHCPGLREAAVIGRPAGSKGEAPVAFITAVAGTTLDKKAVLRFCHEHLAEYKVPREIHILDNLPRTPTGKITKLELKKLL